jgi:hypothetical protein
LASQPSNPFCGSAGGNRRKHTECGGGDPHEQAHVCMAAMHWYRCQAQSRRCLQPSLPARLPPLHPPRCPAGIRARGVVPPLSGPSWLPPAPTHRNAVVARVLKRVCRHRDDLGAVAGPGAADVAHGLQPALRQRQGARRWRGRSARRSARPTGIHRGWTATARLACPPPPPGRLLAVRAGLTTHTRAKK